MEISHRYFLLRSHFERIINTACYWILLYDRITLDGPAAAVKKEKKGQKCIPAWKVGWIRL